MDDTRVRSPLSESACAYFAQGLHAGFGAAHVLHDGFAHELHFGFAHELHDGFAHVLQLGFAHELQLLQAVRAKPTTATARIERTRRIVASCVGPIPRGGGPDGPPSQDL